MIDFETLITFFFTASMQTLIVFTLRHGMCGLGGNPTAVVKHFHASRTLFPGYHSLPEITQTLYFGSSKLAFSRTKTHHRSLCFYLG